MQNPESQKPMGKMGLAHEQFRLLANEQIYLSTFVRNLVAITIGVPPVEERVSPKNLIVNSCFEYEDCAEGVSPRNKIVNARFYDERYN